MPSRPEPPIRVPFPTDLCESRFVARPNRFLLHCELSPDATAPDAGGSGDRVVKAHLADPGRLKELLLPGQRVWLRHAASPTRKTAWSAVLVESPDGDGLVSVDTTMPNRLIHRALEAGALEEFRGWSLERAEWTYGRSRIDFLLARGEERLALEVKSVTLVDDGVALFPDAVTAHVTLQALELAEAVPAS